MGSGCRWATWSTRRPKSTAKWTSVATWNASWPTSAIEALPSDSRPPGWWEGPESWWKIMGQRVQNHKDCCHFVTWFYTFFWKVLIKRWLKRCSCNFSSFYSFFWRWLEGIGAGAVPNDSFDHTFFDEWRGISSRSKKRSRKESCQRTRWVRFPRHEHVFNCSFLNLHCFHTIIIKAPSLPGITSVLVIFIYTSPLFAGAIRWICCKAMCKKHGFQLSWMDEERDRMRKESIGHLRKNYRKIQVVGWQDASCMGKPMRCYFFIFLNTYIYIYI